MATIRGLLAKYRAQSETIREELVFKGLVGREELEPYWPGGSENSGKDVEAWIYCYASMVRFCGRLGQADEKKESLGRSGEDEVLAALSDKSDSVTLSSGSTVTIHPKSFEALRTIERIDDRIGWLCEKRAELAARRNKADLELLDRATAEVSFLYQLMAWGATYPGVSLPWLDPVTGTELEAFPPEQILLLAPTDYLIVRAGLLKVNQYRLAVLSMMLSEKKAPDPAARQTWGTFFALREEQSHTPARTLMRDRSLASQLASALLAGDAHETIRAETERKAEADRVVA